MRCEEKEAQSSVVNTKVRWLIVVVALLLAIMIVTATGPDTLMSMRKSSP